MLLNCIKLLLNKKLKDIVPNFFLQETQNLGN